MKETRTRAIFILIVGVSGLVLCCSLTNGHNWGDDSAAYIMQAESITEAAPRAFIDANRITVEQSSRPVGPTAYPWGYPVLLAPFYAHFGLNPLALKAVGVISFLLFLLVLWLVFRRVHTATGFLCLVCLLALNPTLLGFSNHIMSDLPFLLVSTLCVFLIREVVVLDRCIISRLPDLALIGAGIAFASQIRTSGILLLITLGLSQLISHIEKQAHKRRSNATNEGNGGPAMESGYLGRVSIKTVAAQSVPYVMFFCTVTIWNWVLPDGSTSHLSRLGNISAGMIAGHLLYYFVLPSSFFAGVPNYYLPYGASVPLAIAGAARRYRSDYPAMIYIGLTLLLYVFWPYEQGIRFLFPILPFYLSFAVSELETLHARVTAVKGGLWKALCFLPAFLVILFFGFHAVNAAYRNINDDTIAHGPFAPTSEEMFLFIARHTDTDSTIIFFRPRFMRLMTGRQSVMVDRVEQISRGDYLCLYLGSDASNQLSHSEVEHLLAQGIAKMVYANRDFKVYHLIKGRDSVRANAFTVGVSLHLVPAAKAVLAHQRGYPGSQYSISPSPQSAH